MAAVLPRAVDPAPLPPARPADPTALRPAGPIERIVVVSDAWHPQINGVVRSLATVIGVLERWGHRVTVIGPDAFPSFPCPGYGEIRLALAGARAVGQRIDACAPHAVHIATEGPLGWAARRHCLRHGRPFSTAFHTQFPEYLRLRTGVPEAWSYALLRRFHRPACRTFVSTPALGQRLTARGFTHLADWGRGVDTEQFRPRPDEAAPYDLPRPIMLAVGRVAIEKNLEAFLSLPLPGSKLVVGDGPHLDALRRRYPDAVFAGARTGEELARFYAAADVFVFPSRTDTFGLVLLEALASGVPVAAFPVPGPLDVVTDPAVGCLDDDLARAIRTALTLDRDACRAFAMSRSWEASARQFLTNLAPLVPTRPPDPPSA